jgi:hypothetical protein
MKIIKWFFYYGIISYCIKFLLIGYKFVGVLSEATSKMENFEVGNWVYTKLL